MGGLISESLNEFIGAGVGGYSQEQLERDYKTVISKNFDSDKFTPEESTDFFRNYIYVEYEKGNIQSQSDLYKKIMG